MRLYDKCRILGKRDVFSAGGGEDGAICERVKFCLNHDFRKIFKISRINLENLFNLVEIVVQDNEENHINHTNLY